MGEFTGESQSSQSRRGEDNQLRFGRGRKKVTKIENGSV